MASEPPRTARTLALVLAALLVGACAPDLESDPPPTDGVRAVFDAEAGTVPLPNDAALDEQGTLPRLEGAGADSANGVFLDWLDSLHGWLTSQPITVPFDGALNPETVDKENVRLFEIREDGSLRRVPVASVEMSEKKVAVTRNGETVRVDGTELTIRPDERLSVRTQYAAAISNDIEGRPSPDAEFRPVQKPPAVFFAASREPLVDENGEKTLEVLPDDATAQSLEKIRQDLAPLFSGLSERGWAREDVAMAFAWTTVRDPRSIFDPETGTVPIPNVLALDEDGTFPKAALDHVGEDSAQGDLDSYLDRLHHWPPSTPIRLPVDADLEPFTLGPKTVQLWRLPEKGAPSRLEVADRKMVQECTGLAECLAGCGAGDTACRKSCRDHATSGAESNYASLKSCAESNGCQAGALDSACLKDNCSSERSACRQLSEQADVEGYVRLVPKEPLPKRARFAAFVTSGVTNRDRMPLKAPAAVRMAIQPHPVFEDGESTVASLSAEQAKGIQNQLRPVLQPLASTVESKTDVDRSDIVGLWTWTTWTDTFVQFDPGGGVLPFPNEFVRQGMNGRVSIPTDGATGLQKTLIETLNRRQGFSTTAPGWIPVDGPIDEASLSPSSVPLLWIPGSRKYGGDHYSLNYRSKWNQLTFRPEQPLEKDDAYVDEPNTLAFHTGVVTTDLKGGNGHPVRPSASFVFLRSRHPLIANGDIKVEQLQSQVDSGELKKSDVQLLESARQTFNQLLPLAKGLAGVESRDQVASAFAFHPENMPQAVQDARARAIASFEARSKGAKRADRSSGKSWSAVSDPGQSYTGPGGGWPAVDMSGVARIQWTASFETVRMLKPEQQTDGRLRDQSNLTTEKVGISVFLPRQSPPQGGNGGRAYCHSPAPVVVAQHGLGSARVEAGMALANQLAQRGIAVVTMDFLGHGGRTDGASTLHPPQTPSKSGEGFLTKNVVRSKNRVLQSIVDVAVLARLIRRGGLESAVDADQATDCFRDGSNAGLGYVGHSLGGFVGAPLLAVDPTVKVGVLNGAGGRYSRILTEGALGGSLEQALTDAGLKKGSFGRFRALAFVQWIADHVDPLAFAPFLTRASLDVRTFDSGNGFSTGDSVGGNELLVQMLEKPGTGDDDVVPNATTEAFAEAAQPGVPLDQATFPGDHGLLFDLDPGNRADSVRCARRQLAAWLKSGLTGKAEIPDSLKAGNCLGGGP